MKQTVLLFLFTIITLTAFSQTGFNDRLNIDFHSEKVDIKVYPNPVVDNLRVSDNNDIDQVQIFNLVGKTVKSYDYLKGRNYYVGDLPKGIYLVQFSDRKSKTIVTKRISKR
jgi:hypothetical protein